MPLPDGRLFVFSVAGVRFTALCLLFLFFAVPLAAPFLDAPIDFDRLPSLIWNTMLLAGCTCLLALPAGTVAAVLLFRTNLPFAGFFRFATVIALFVALALLTSAWQASLGAGGLLPFAWWGESQGRPWAEGMGPAIWIHTQAALPWVTLIVGFGLRQVEPELEEDALLAAGPWQTVRAVTLPRCAGAMAAAAAWVVLQVAGDITVTNVMLVSTMAEEVLGAFQEGGGAPLTRALQVAMPFSLVAGACVYWLLCRAEKIVPAIDPPLRSGPVLPLGWARWPSFALVSALMLLLCGVPLSSLIWKTGAVGYPPSWSLVTTGEHLASTLSKDGLLIGKSLFTSLVSAVATASIALMLAWLALEAPRFRQMLFAIAAAAWVLPGPVVGIGLKETIMTLVTYIPWRPLTVALYEGPESPVPVLWAHALRFLPCAVAILWPVARQSSSQLSQTVLMESANPADTFRLGFWPAARATWWCLVVILTALSLGEVGAVAMSVETPGWQMFAHVLFNRMHYGVAPDVAALGLALLLVIASVSGLLAWLRWFMPRRG
jgi:ABC-type Fe3+ transport system permease subunit